MPSTCCRARMESLEPRTLLAAGPTLRIRSLFGDADQNGRVDAMDLRRVLVTSAAGSNMRTTFLADLDLSGSIDIFDLLAVRRNLGHTVRNDA